MTFNECFYKLGKETVKEFDKQLKGAIESKEDNEINIILVDKNYPQGIDKFLKQFCKNKESQYFIIYIILKLF